MVIVTIRPWKNFNTSKQLIAIERKVVVQFGCLVESCIVCYLTAWFISLYCNQNAFSVLYANSFIYTLVINLKDCIHFVFTRMSYLPTGSGNLAVHY